MKATLHGRDSDSGHSPSDDEKRIGVPPGGFEELGRDELPPDPDGHLSDAERARIVRRFPSGVAGEETG